VLALHNPRPATHVGTVYEQPVQIQGSTMPPDSQFPTSSPADSAMLGAIVDTSGSVILGLHPDHRIFAWNRAAEQLYQTPRAQAIGMDYVETFLAPEHRDAVRADIQEVLAGKRTLDFEDDSLLPDGTRRTLLWNVSRVLDTTGLPVGIVATGQDITARQEAEERFRLVFEHTSDGLLISDASGVVDCNPAALSMLGFTSKEQLIGRRPAEFSPLLQPDGVPSAEKSRALGAITLERGAYTFDWVHQRPDGTDVPIEVSVQHAMLNSRRVSIVAWRDQTRRVALDRERATVEERLSLAQKLEAVGQLAGGVAHEFNNLLAAIRNSIQLAVNEVPRDLPVHADLELALQTTTRAASLTGQLLTFSQQPVRGLQRIDVAQVVHDMLPLLRASLPTGVTLHVAVEPASVFIMADRGQLEQALVNIVLNARDAMPNGGELTIALGVHANGTQAQLAVRDSGTGMDDSVKARMFEPFFSTKAIGANAGLGLAVVYGVVTQIGGTITVESAPGRGTALEITLPITIDTPAAIAPDTVRSADERAVVLLVDDDRAVRSTTRRLLERSNFTVVDLADGAEALSRFTAEPGAFDVLLSDIRMPHMDGVQLAHAVRAVSPGFPVVFISGFGEPGAQWLDTLSSVQLVAKPFASDRLFSALRRAITERVPAG